MLDVLLVLRAEVIVRRRLFLVLCLAIGFAQAAAVTASDRTASFDDWAGGRFTVNPVSPGEYHSIHSYYLTCPESPDGRHVLFFASTTRDGHTGELRIRERATGQERTLATGINTEDAHRAACQQWLAGGTRVAFHHVTSEGEWQVRVIDVESGKDDVAAKWWQCGFGQPRHDLLPLYGPHWRPEDHTAMALLNVRTGQIAETSLTPEVVRAAQPDWVAKTFGDRRMSVFFPILSPDSQRVFFKTAASTGDDFRSKQASIREGLLVYDLAQSKLLSFRPRWGHPAWHPDSRHVLEVSGLLIDSTNGSSTKLENYPKLSGAPHPSFGPEGKMFASDGLLPDATIPESKRPWLVIVGETATGRSVTIKQFDNSRGAASWRKSHPHPIFSADGRRLYFNVSEGPWTQLYVAEIESSTGTANDAASR